MRAAVWLLVTAIACHHDHAARPVEPVASSPRADAVVAEQPKSEPAKPEPLSDEDIDIRDILSRDTTTSPVVVKHVLIGWATLAPVYHDKLDHRAAARDN